VVNPNPNITLSETNIEVCGDSEAVIDVNGVSNISWNGGTGIVTGTSPNELIVSATPSLNTVYTISGSNGFNCFDSTNLSVSVPQNAGFNFTTESFQICEGYNLGITVSGGNNNYLWSPNISNSINGVTAEASPTVNTTYYVTSEISDYCIFEDSILIEVDPIPNVFITNANMVLCPNSSTSLNINIQGDFIPNGTIQVFSSDLTVISNTEILVEPSFLSGTQSYDIFYDANFGCISAISTFTVSIEEELPVEVIASSNTICEGESLILEFIGANNFTYSPAANTTVIANDMIEVSPNSTTTYTINGNTGTCVGDTTFEVIVNTNPTLSIDVMSPAEICIDSFQVVNLSGALTYSFSPNNSVQTISSSSFELSPTSSTVYTITGTAPNTCTSDIDFTLNIDPFVNIGLILSDNDLCIGESATILASNGDVFNWNYDPSLNNTNSSIVTATPNVTTTYFIDAESFSGCSLSDSITVNVAPEMNIATSGDQYICENTSFTLFSSGGTFYNWTPDTYLSDPNIATPTCTPLSDIVYTVTITDIFGCEEVETVSVTLVNSPVLDVEQYYDVCSGDTLFFNFSAQNFNTISWSGGSGNFGDPNILNTYYYIDENETASSIMLTVDLTSDCGDLSETIELRLVEDLLAISAGPDQEICDNEIFIFPEIESENSINWSGGNGSISVYENSYQYDPASSESNSFVTLYLEESNLCSTVTDSISLYINAVEATNIISVIGDLELVDIPGQTDFTTIELDPDGLYQWNYPEAVGCNISDVDDLSECWLVDLFPTTSTTFEVLDITDNCKSPAFISILVDEFESGYLYVPTAFSPNGDGHNEIFLLNHNKIDRETFTFQIFNRYGQLVFQTNEPDESWDGMFNGEKQGIGVFVWMVSYNYTYDSKNKIEQGNLTLVR